MRFAAPLCAICALALGLTGCRSGPPAVLRNSDLMRELFYPPAVPRGELEPDTVRELLPHVEVTGPS